MPTDRGDDAPKCVKPDCTFINNHGDEYDGLCLPCWNRKNQELARSIGKRGRGGGQSLPSCLSALIFALDSLAVYGEKKGPKHD